MPNRWLGTATQVAQIVNATPAGTVETGDQFIATFPNNKALTYTSTAATVASVVTGFTAAWNASTQPEFAEVTAVASGTTSITLTADTAGKPFEITLSTIELSTVTAAPTFTTTTAGTTSAGPNHFNTAANWSGNLVPAATDDVFIENSSVDILYGLESSGVTVVSLNIAQNYTGKLGLPERNAGGYSEYRTTSLQLAVTSARIGYGSGAGSGRIKWNGGTVQTAINVLNTGSPIENGVESFLFTGTNTSNSLNVNKGSVGIGIIANTTSALGGGLTLSYINQVASDAKVRCGSGVFLFTVTQNGGELETNSAITTKTQTAGTHNHMAGAMTTLSVDGGTCFFQSTGTVTTLNISGGGEINYTRDSRARTVTTTNLYGAGKITDPNGTVAWTSGIDLERCAISDVVLELGTHIKLSKGTPS